jgi:uncharacterized SAM-binding protein YcdF (DUF218 family)
LGQATTTLVPGERPPGASPSDRPSRSSRPPRRAVRRIIIALLVAAALVFVYLGVTFAQVWSATTHDDSSPADAIVVLGAAQWNGKPSPVLQDRLDHAVQLYRDGVAKTIVVVGGKQAGDRTSEGKAGYDYLRAKGIPDSALKVEVEGTDTYEELSSTALILRQGKLGDDVVLVTDRYHAYRAAATAGEVGLDAHVSPVGAEPSLSTLARETGGVALGRIIGFRRLQSHLSA